MSDWGERGGGAHAARVPLGLGAQRLALAAAAALVVAAVPAWDSVSSRRDARARPEEAGPAETLVEQVPG